MGESLHEFVAGLFAEPGATAVQELPSSSGPAPLSLHDAPVEKAGDQVGRYQLVEPLGAGGFGTVWRAEQGRPVRREVALKILKLGMDTREVVARFEAERQVLALLDHPHIAKVFDAGATVAGRPYFVMELVRGVPIVRYCRERDLPLPQRLALFAEVCRAVQHAHQKGIIHRDLKPSNLLVTETDGRAAPKVIDFGIAKATGGEHLTDGTLFTNAGQCMGTPAYMSPEQSGMALDIDTRTDVYSLGVVLYELLTGKLPRVVGPDGRVDHARDPERPSKWNPAAKGDLDWIVMRALEADRTRRYESAVALAEDLGALVRHEPVSARPPTPWYLLKRFAQRNTLGVSAAAAIVLVLLTGAATSTWLYLGERRALARSRQATARSEQVSGFLKRLLDQAGPAKALGRDTTMMRELLDDAATRIGAELHDQPEVAAELRDLMAGTYESIDEYERSLAQADEAVRLLRSVHAGGDEQLAEALTARGSSLESLGRMKEAEADLREALAMRRRRLGEQDPRTAETSGLLAWTLVKSGRAPEAEPFAKAAYEVWRRHPAYPHLSIAAKAMEVVYIHTNRQAEGVAVDREELANARQQHGAENPDVMNALDSLGYDLVGLKQYDEAEPLLLESLHIGEKLTHGRNPTADHAYASLARIAAARQQWDKQLEYARASFDAARKTFPAGHRYYRESSSVLGSVLLDQASRCAESDPARAIVLLDELTGSADFEGTVKSANGWVDCLRGLALRPDPVKRDEANALLQHGLDSLKKKVKPTAADQQRIQKATQALE
jgi:serine/threonine protein kinase